MEYRLMSDAEKRELFLKLPNPEVELFLLQSNMNLVYAIVKSKRMYIQGATFEELVLDGTFGLIKAIKTYNPDKFMFSTYAAKCIVNEIYERMRFLRKAQGFVQFEAEVVKGVPLTFLDIIADQTIDVEKEGTDKEVLRLIMFGIQNCLTPKEREVIEMCFFENKTQSQIALKLNATQSYISRVRSRALKKLRVMFEDGTLLAKWHTTLQHGG